MMVEIAVNKLIVETLSPATQDLDRQLRAADDREIDSIEEILIVQQTAMYREVRPRLEGNRWLADIVRGPDSRLWLESVGLNPSLRDLHAKIALDPGELAGTATRPPV